MDIDRAQKRTVIERVRETLDGDGGIEAFHVTATHDDGVEYMVSTTDQPAARSRELYECLAADVTAVARLLDEDPAEVARRAGQMAAAKDSVGDRWDDSADPSDDRVEP